MSLVLAGVCFAAALAFSAGGWRALLPDGVSVVQACARFGCGSLANTVLPLHGGNVLRINLFGRIVPGGMLAVAGAVAVFSTARWLTLLPLAGTVLPPEALLVPAAGLATAVVLARRHRASPWMYAQSRSEEHTSELQSRFDLVCRLLLEKKNTPRLIDDPVQRRGDLLVDGAGVHRSANGAFPGRGYRRAGARRRAGR